MFLLILAGTLKTGQSNPDFTFHNVSINTKTYKVGDIVNFHFTFHNVSINTMHVQSLHFAVLYFTFHNVSINTSPILHTVVVFDLYIPQCFY